MLINLKFLFLAFIANSQVEFISFSMYTSDYAVRINEESPIHIISLSSGELLEVLPSGVDSVEFLSETLVAYSDGYVTTLYDYHSDSIITETDTFRPLTYYCYVKNKLGYIELVDSEIILFKSLNGGLIYEWICPSGYFIYDDPVLHYNDVALFLMRKGNHEDIRLVSFSIDGIEDFEYCIRLSKTTVSPFFTEGILFFVELSGSTVEFVMYRDNIRTVVLVSDKDGLFDVSWMDSANLVAALYLEKDYNLTDSIRPSFRLVTTLVPR